MGESEKAVATLFARARAAAPAIVFFDEIDALAAARPEDGGTGEGWRVCVGEAVGVLGGKAFLPTWSHLMEIYLVYIVI